MAAMGYETLIPVGTSIARLVLLASGYPEPAAAAGEVANLLTTVRGMLKNGGVRAIVAEKIADDFATQLLREHQGISEADWHVAAQLVASLIDQLPEKERLAAGYDWKEIRRTLFDLGGTDLRSKLVDESARQSFDWVLEVACQRIAVCFTEKEALASLLETVDEVRTGIQRLADRPAGASQTRAVVADHNEVVRDLAPELLEDREREISELEAFVSSSQEAWYAIEAGMVSGKTALMSSFALNPPDGAHIVSFFARRIGGDGNDWMSFAFVAGSQLAEILGNEYTERVSDPASQDTEFRQLLRRAATACRTDKNPRPLVLLIDGVDEDSYYERPDDAAAKSILSLLPRHLPEGVKVMTASRLNPRPPEDIVCDTSRVVVSIDPSPVAQKRINQKDIETFFKSDYAADIGAFLAACGGSLTIDELRQLVSMRRCRDNVPSKDIKACVDRSPGRMLMRVNVGFGGQEGVSYTLGHDAVLRAVVREIAPDLFGDDDGVEDTAWWAQIREDVLKPYREIVRKWVVDRADGGWGRATPNYMLSNACFSIMLDHDIQIVLHPDRYNEMQRRFGRRSQVLRMADLEFFKTLDVNRGEISENAMKSLLGVAEMRGALVRASIYLPGLLGLYVSHFDIIPEAALDIVLSVDEPYNRLNAFIETAIAAVESGRGSIFLPLFPVVLDSLGSCRDLRDSILRLLADVLVSIDGVANDSKVSDIVSFDLKGWINRVLVSAKMEDSLLRFCSSLNGVDDLSENSHAIVPLRLAEHIAEWIEDSWTRARVLAGLAGTLARADDTGGVRRVTDNAMNTVGRIQNSRQCVWVLAEVAGALVRAGDFERARRVAEDAASAAEQIEVPWERVWTLGGLASGLAKAGLADEALAVAERIGDPREREEALSKVAGALARADLADEALAMAEQLEESRLRARALAGLAGALARAGDSERARRVAQNAASAAEQMELPWDRVRVLGGVASGLARAGLADEALAVADRIGEPRASGLAWVSVADGALATRERADVLVEVAGALAQVGDFERARRVAQNAASAAEQIEVSWERVWALSEVAGALAKVGLTDEALAVAERIEESRERARALSEVAGALARADLADEALGIISVINDPNSRSYAQSSFTKALVREGSSDEAAEAMRVELAWARGIAQRRDAVECYATLATACLDAADLVEAESTMREQWLGLARSALAHSLLYGASVWDHFDILMRVAPGLAVRLVNERILAAPEGGTDSETEPGCGSEGPGGDTGSYR